MKKFASALCTLLVAALPVLSQQQPKPDDDVIRVETNLVQTSITVLDKKGNFVEGLKPEDFQLRIDGRPATISFLSRITAGTAAERAQYEALRKGSTAAPPQPESSESIGRTIIFFIDDLHLSPKSVSKTRQLITNFITTQMAPNDSVAIASSSGQIGFLQQFTDNKTVLLAAVSRLNYKPYVVHDTESIPMTEYAALRVDAGDKDALTYYANELLKAMNFQSQGGPVGPPRGGGAVGTSQANNPNKQSSGMSREMAEHQVKERALMILKQSAAVTTSTLAGFENLLHTALQQTGRKLVFFVSDGFFLNDRNTGADTKIHELTDVAVRAGVVIYSLDARGLISTTDATSNRADPEGRLSRSNVGEVSASQDGMNALAGDTGGRALFNSEMLGDAVDRALQETSNYYLIGWRPDTDEQKSSSFKRIEITVAGRSDLTVRLPRGYLNNLANARATTKPEPLAGTTSTDKPADVDLKRALSAALPQTTIPTTVSVSFIDAPDNGAIVTAGVQTAATALSYGDDGKQAAVDLAGVILNDQGKPAATFRTRLTVNAIPVELMGQDTGVVYNYKAKLAPGLYQLRAAVRDEKTGKVGSATQWIEVPDLSKKQLALSSLLLRASKKNEAAPASAEPQFSVDRHFHRGSQLNFLMFIYNATRNAPASQSPDVTAQVEVLRNGAAVVSTPVRKLNMDGMADLGRIPYGGQFPLEALQAGRYELRITITDRLAKSSASQRLQFQVD
ncbi:MAG TPA: VWA domain-containing protein [Pyrinomonadaceae bacterium]